ncbi:MAG TPA: thioesterase family protein [Bacteroidia bacterium]|jgi:acyl-CoA thioester hydrolase
MFTAETKLRVRYGETDQMGFAYYGNYAEYYEVARVEALRALGMSYREMEEDGIMLPVYTFSIKYHKPAFYDDELTIRCTIPQMPGARIRFDYECFNAAGELLNRGETTLVFINKITRKPCGVPQHFIEKLKHHFS